MAHAASHKRLILSYLTYGLGIVSLFFLSDERVSAPQIVTITVSYQTYRQSNRLWTAKRFGYSGTCVTAKEAVKPN